MQKRSQAVTQVILLIAILIAANVLGQYVFYRFDLTKEKRFTLTQPTQDLLGNLNDIVYVRVYLEGEFPAGFKRLRNATLEMLDEFRAYSGGLVEYEFVDPFEEAANLEEREQIMNQLMEKGLEPRRLVENEEGYSEKMIFPGAIMRYKGRELPIGLLLQQLNKGPQEVINNSVALLEYNLANTIQKLQKPKQPAIAFIEGQGELSINETRDIMVALSPYYRIQRFNLTEQLYIPPSFSVAIVARPTEPFKDSNKFKLDQYIMNGGRVLWLVENLATSLDSLNNAQGFFPLINYQLGLEDLLFKYGVRVNFDVVQDLQCSKIPLVVGVDNYGNAQQQQLFPWPYSPIITDFNNQHPITKNMDAVLTQFTATIDTIITRKNNIKKTVLMQTSPYTKRMQELQAVDVNDLRRPPVPDEYQGGEQIVGVALEGEFPSLFKNRLSSATKTMIDTIEGVSFKTLSETTKMVIVADGDIIRNDYNEIRNETKPLGYYKFTSETFANKDLIVNAVEWLNDDNNIIAARSKDVKLRLLDAQKVKEGKLQWQLLNMLLPLVLIVVFGVGFIFVRKKRFA